VTPGLSLAAVLAALTLAGCGAATHSRTASSSSTTTSSSVNATSSNAAPAVARAPSKAAFITRADTICRQVNAKVSPLKAQLNGTSASLARLPAIVASAVSDAQTGLARLRALREPSGSGPVLAKVWNAIDAQIVDTQNMAQAEADDNTPGLQAAEQSAQTAQALYRGLAQGYGFDSCGASHS
jgi:hypothetical protein